MKIKAIERTENSIRIVDQTKLPTEVVYHDYTSYKQIIEAIKTLQVRGAPAIGVAAAYGVALSANDARSLSLDYLKKVGKELIDARPTAVNLPWAVNRMLDSVNSVSDFDEVKVMLWSEAELIHEEDRQMCQAIGKNGAELLKDNSTILTHCHTGALATGGIGTAAGVIYTAIEQGKKLKIYADETRPLLQGARLTAWEMMQEGIDVTLICDNTAGMLMAQGKIDAVIVGADRIAKNGDTANKIGTYSVAVLAEKHNIPFYVAAPQTTFDDDIKNGTGIIIEERAPLEVTNGFGKQTAPDKVKVYSPAFDVTPVSLITAHITDQGIIYRK